MNHPTDHHAAVDKILVKHSMQSIAFGSKQAVGALHDEAKQQLLSLLAQARLNGGIEELESVRKATTKVVMYQYDDGSRVVVDQRINQLKEQRQQS